MLGSVPDAEDAVQDALLRAWRGLPGFAGNSSLRSWLYRIATNVCLRMIERRPKLVLPIDYGPPSDPHGAREGPALDSLWIDPLSTGAGADGLATPEARYEQRESVELAFIAALQHLPARQRAVLLLRDVLGFSPSEIATALDVTPTAVYSLLARAHETVERRLPERSQQATLGSLTDERLRDLVERYVRAWEEADVPGIVGLLTEDATFSMPPRPSWYQGRAAIGAFLAWGPVDRPDRWRHVTTRANGQLAFGVYESHDAGEIYLPHAIEVLALNDDAQIVDVVAFHQAEAFTRFGLPAQIDR
ncbi:MAG: hypothetical protein QOD66_3788 [Solirubrobacteraceae bacterium]|jgi:RNA polymerase sigma-70 factor (ECF subfamily)|nr:hypothetical protein [Solirubrobacteraceae bacterium]